MANVIKHKRGSGSDPAANNLVLGELAIRTDTGKLFTKMDSGAIAEIAGGGSDIAINTLSSSSGTGGGSATFNGSAYRFTLSAPPNVSAAQLLVSINGVIQKPVAGTGQPSEGFSVDGTDIILGDAPATGSDFFILTFKSLGVSEPADNSVTSAKIVDGAIVNADINASAAIAGSKIDPDFGSQNIVTTGFITSNDITISDTSPTLRFTDTNHNSDFRLTTDGGLFQVIDTTNSNALRIAVHSDGEVDLYNHVDIGAGLDVTGAITGTGDLTIDTNTLHVDSSNNRVGIGTASPSHLLHVQNNSTTTTKITVESTGTNSYPAFRLVNDARAYDLGIDGATDAFRIYDVTGTAERMRIDSSGRLLYGLTSSTRETSLILQGNSNSYTTNPGTLEVRIGQVPSAQTTLGQINFGCTGDKIGGTISAIADNADWSSGSSHPTAIRFFTTPVSSTTQAERMRIDSSGRLLLGTTTEGNNNGDELTIAKDSGNMGMTLRSGDSSNSHIYFSDATSGAGEYAGYIAYQHSDDSMHIGTNSAERIHIKSSGSVGIGTSSPSVKLHVNGGSGLLVERSTGTSVAGFKHTGATAMNIYFQNSGSTNHPSIGSSNQDLTLGTNNTERLRVLSGGGLTFNGDTAAANALDDYEEGTFTPVLKGTSGGGTLTSSSAAGSGGNYTKVGNKVHLSFYFANPTGSNPSGTLYFELPFSVASGNDYNGSGGCVTYTRNIFPETDRMFAVNAIAGTNKLYIARVSVGGQGETGYQTINNDSDLTSMLFKATVSYAAA